MYFFSNSISFIKKKILKSKNVVLFVKMNQTIIALLNRNAEIYQKTIMKCLNLTDKIETQSGRFNKNTQTKYYYSTFILLFCLFCMSTKNLNFLHFILCKMHASQTRTVLCVVYGEKHY